MQHSPKGFRKNLKSIKNTDFLRLKMALKRDFVGFGGCIKPPKKDPQIACFEQAT
jgi:hypothetical protein